MRILLHDFSGHPFQAELSRQLAGEGHTVEHVFSEQYVSGKGHLARQDGDAEGLSFTGLRLDIPFRKYAPLSRLRWERSYARHWISTLRSAEVDCVIACNLPLFTLFLFARFAKKRKLPWILWHQDIYSFALGDELRRKLPRPLAALGARMLIRMERYCARNAQHVVAIGDAFEGVYREWKIPSGHVSVIPNWAPLDKVFPVDRDNPRAAALFPDAGRLRLLYAGTIGRKHNPQLLVELLRAAEGTKPQLVVVSEGEAADDLAAIAAADPSLPLTVLPFQPAEDLPEVLGSADVLVALLEVDATKFSIPSKVLTYMAAGRPILGLMPADNPAALDITETGGFVAAPDSDGARSSAAWLASLQADPALVTEVGHRTRAVAEDKFDVAKVAKEFELIIGTAVRTTT
jgi:colanic acid biosynthesis glycosyl transferase WcaI